MLIFFFLVFSFEIYGVERKILSSFFSFLMFSRKPNSLYMFFGFKFVGCGCSFDWFLSFFFFFKLIAWRGR